MRLDASPNDSSSTRLRATRPILAPTSGRGDVGGRHHPVESNSPCATADPDRPELTSTVNHHCRPAGAHPRWSRKSKKSPRGEEVASGEKATPRKAVAGRPNAGSAAGRRQPSDPQGVRRHARAGLHRGDAGLEARRRAPPRRPHRPDGPRRVQGGEVELTLLWHRRRGLVPQHPLLHQVREGGVLPGHVTASGSAPARRSTTKCASTSTRTTSSTKPSSASGSSRRASYRARTSERTPSRAIASGLALALGFVQGHGGSDELLQRLLVDLRPRGSRWPVVCSLRGSS